MSWYYGDWSWVQGLITMATLALLAATLVAGCVALVRSHRHPADPAVVVTNGVLVSPGASRRPSVHEPTLGNGHRAA